MKRSPSSAEIVDGAALTFGKTFLLYALPVTLLRRKVKKATLRRASAIGAFMAVTKAAQLASEVVELPRQYAWLRKYSHGLSGGLGALIAILVDSGLANSTFVFWIAVRALRCVWEESALNAWTSKIPFLPTIVMCWSANEILCRWIRTPHHLDPSYKRFLDIQGGRPMFYYDAMRNRASPVSDPMRAFGFGLSDAISFMPAAMKRAARLYAPLYALLLAVSMLQARNRTPERAKRALSNFVTNLFRSSAFLAVYCTMAWTSFSVWPFSRIYSVDPANSYMLGRNLAWHGWMSGLATLIERKERRPELAAYCASYALDGMWTGTTLRLGVPERLKTVIMSLLLISSCAALIHYHSKQPAVVTKWLLGFSTEDILPKRRSSKEAQEKDA